MNVKLPKKVKVSGFTLDVGTKPVADPGDHGGVDFNSGTVYINPSIGAQQQRSVFVHEILHCLLRYSGAKYSVGMNDLQEETMVRVLEPIIFNFLKDNPQVIKYITEKV